MTLIENYPVQLKNDGLFCVWRYEERDGHKTKVPYNPRTGQRAKSNDPDTFAPLSIAEEKQSGFDGLGVGIFNGLCAVDIDNCITDGMLSDMAQDIVAAMRSYTEISPSGHGVRILFKAAGFHYDTKTYYIHNKKLGLEIYVSGATQKYVTVTGNVKTPGADIEERGRELQYVLDKYMKRDCPQAGTNILSVIKKSKDTAKFEALFERGDISAYASHSEADIALCNILAFYCQGDFDAIDSHFRQSKLYREKWERVDYRTETIHKAIESCGGEFYTPKVRAKKARKSITIAGEEYDTLDERALTAYLNDIGASVKYNVITREVEIKGIEQSYNPESIVNDLPIILFDRLKNNLNRCNKTNVQDLLSVIAGKCRFNPVTEMLERGTWDGANRLQDLYSILHIPEYDKLSRTLIYKWLWQSLSMARNELLDAYGADGVLVLQGRQGLGKTTFVRKMAVCPALCKLGQYLDSRDKDTYRRACSAWLVEFGEIESTFKSDLERLKGFITSEIDEYRLPYGRSDQRLARRTSIVGTCNSAQFLIDPTGSRRFWTIPLTAIDLERLAVFDSLQLWQQIDAETKHNRQGFRLTKDEQARLADRNAKHEKPLPGQAEVMDVLAKQDPDLEYRDVTVSVFKDAHKELSHYSVDQIGKVLSKLGIERGFSNSQVDGKRTSARTRNLPVRKEARPLIR